MVTPIDRTDLLRLIDEGDAQIVDVLPGDEYRAEHIPGAINIPLRHLTADTVSGLRRDKPVVVY